MRSPARAVASILWRSAASGTEIAALAKPPLGKSLTGLPVLPIRRRRHLLLRNPRLSLLLQQKTRRENPINRKLPDRKSTRLNSSHTVISYAVFCLKKKKKKKKKKESENKNYT